MARQPDRIRKMAPVEYVAIAGVLAVFASHHPHSEQRRRVGECRDGRHFCGRHYGDCHASARDETKPCPRGTT